MRAVGLFQCRGEDDSELDFNTGDLIENVMASDEPGWFSGVFNNKQGLFPGNYVKFEQEIADGLNEELGDVRTDDGAKLGNGSERRLFSKQNFDMPVNQSKIVTDVLKKRPPPPPPSKVREGVRKGYSQNQSVSSSAEAFETLVPQITSNSFHSTDQMGSVNSVKTKLQKFENSAYSQSPKPEHRAQSNTSTNDGLRTSRISMNIEKPPNVSGNSKSTQRKQPSIAPTDPNAFILHNPWQNAAPINSSVEPFTAPTMEPIITNERPPPLPLRPISTIPKQFTQQSGSIINTLQTALQPNLAPKMPPRPAPPMKSSTTHSSLIIPNDAKERYLQLFNDCDRFNRNLLSSNDVKSIWTKSQLDPIVLGNIWNLLNPVNDSLTSNHFCIGINGLTKECI